jgi:outer membrane usher protein
VAQSKQQRRSSSHGWLSLAFLLALLPALFAGTAEAQEPESVPLQLEVQMNGQPLNLIGAFSQMPDGKIGSPRSELLELGVAVSSEGAPEDIVMLDTVPGLSYAYDEENQSISLDVAETSRIAKEINAAEGKGDLAPESSMGLVVNYTGYSAASYNIEDEIAGLNGGSVSLDARAFSRFGTINQTGILGTTTFADLTALRLDTVWAYSDEKRALTYRLGDIVSGGLNWTRPVRLGGGQLQRNFGLRPDLVTMPVPTIEGTAKVPSTVDVYIDGVKAYSGQLQEGPFKVDNLPVYTNEGTVKVVLTDATGREVETESEFITSPELLKRDLYDVSLEAGVLRRDFGSESFGYADEPVAIGSFRYGIADILTGEAHAEIGMGLYSGGVGVLVSGGKAGLFSGAVAASTYEGETGVFLNAGWEASFGNLGMSAATSRSFGDFMDLAAVSTIPTDPDVKTGVPRALDRVSFSYSFPELKIGLGASFIHLQEANGARSFLVSGSYSQTIFDNMTLYGSAYADFGDEEEFGAFVGLSIPIGETMSAMTSASATVNGVAATAEVSKSFGEGDMPTAWRVSHTEREDRFTAASGAVRGSKAALQASVSKQGDSVRANAVVEGALVAAGGTVMAGRKINDSFAIVNVGAPDVPVEFENRYAGKTGKSGKILLQDLNSFQKNKISINVESLPLTAEVLETEKIVVPRDLSGVVVDFGVKAEQAAALVILTDAEGKFIPEGSEVVLEGAAESFVMGYDGQAYLTGIGSSNTVTVKHGNAECRAQFDFKAEGDTQTSIGPLTCS